jgi:T5SS/PEP-CTERM-associated repeat protein
MRSPRIPGAILCAALLLTAPAARAQLVPDGGTTVLNGLSTNITGTVDIGTSADFSLLILTNGGDLRNTGIAYLGRNAGSDFNRVFVNGLGSYWSNVSDLFIGFAGANNSLFIQNGGTVSNRTGTLGGNAVGATNNMVMVDGTGSLWINQNDLEIGLQGGGNKVIVTNGGRVVVRSAIAADGTYLGHFDGAGGNQLLVSGPGSAFSNLFTLHHGYGGGGNLIRVESGGRLDTEVVYMGEFATASNNVIEVTGAGSLLRNIFEFVAGSNSAGNRLTISDGGRLMNTVGTLGGSATASNNVAWVTGGGSLWSNSGSLHIGGAGARNQLVVSNGGTVFARNAANLGFSASSTNNRIEIAGGNLIVSNSAGTATLDIRRGTNVLNGGLVDADRLFVTNALGRFEFLKGLLRSRYTEITNGFAFETGNGTDIAFLELEGAGTHRFGNGLVIRSNGTVRARSTTPILSPAGVTIQMGGTLLYQLGNQFAAATPLTLSGGRFDLGGNTQAAALGALTLSATSTIDLGAGGAQTLQFSSLASYTPGSQLIIQNWTGTPTYGGGTDQILFTGGAGVTPGFLSEVRFLGFPDGALLLGTGEIVPTPEPATWLALAALGGTFLWRRRR